MGHRGHHPIGWPAFATSRAVYAPGYTSEYYSPPPTVIVPSAPAAISPATETLPPPVVDSARPVPERPATELNFASQGMELFQAGKYPEAVRALRHAVVDDPRNANLLALTGQALFAAGSHGEAAGALQQSLATTPEADWASVSSKMTKLAPADATEGLRKAIARIRRAGPPVP